MSQAIAFFELSKPEHKELLAESHLNAGTFLRSMAETKDPRFAGLELDELAVEIAVCIMDPVSMNCSNE
jgi:hypothetical protein